MSLLTAEEQRFDLEVEGVFCATIQRLIHDALEAADNPDVLESVCEQWDELLREFRALEKETLLPREGTEQELRSHKVIYQQAIALAGLLRAAAERVNKIGWNLDAGVRAMVKERLGLLERQNENLVFQYNGWHGPRLSPAQIELAKKLLGVPV